MKEVTKFTRLLKNSQYQDWLYLIVA